MLRVISWNLHRRQAAWSVVNELAKRHGAHVALVQEATAPPEGTVVDVEPPAGEVWRWHCPVPPVSRGYASAVASLDPGVELAGRPATPLTSSRHGQDELVATHPGQFAVADVTDANGWPVTLISLYGLWEYVAATGQGFAEGTLHRAISDLTGLLQTPGVTRVVIAGDLNVWRHYGHPAWQASYESVFERLAAYGFEVVGPVPPPGRGPLPRCPCGPAADCAHVATFRYNGQQDATPYHNDWVLARAPVASIINRCEVIDDELTWSVSDHAPILFELAAPPLATQ